jgi:hypothetical protein
MAQKDKTIASQPFVRRITTIEKERYAAALQHALAFQQCLRSAPRAPRK